MAWFILGFFIYFTILLSERIVVLISPHQLEQLRSEPGLFARVALRLSDQTPQVLFALLLARILVKILIGVFLAVLLAQMPPIHAFLSDWSVRLGLPASLIWWLAGTALVLGLGLTFWTIKQFSRRLVIREYSRVAFRRLSLFILFWKTLFTPVLSPKKSEAETGSALLPKTSNSNTPSGITGETQREIELLKSIVKFSDVTVKQVMQPRSKIVAVGFRTHFSELLDVVREAGFSRLPVYDEDLDNVTGILYVKDLVPHLSQPGNFEWQSLIRTNMLVPESKRISELLQEFKQKRRHMAIVVDEYGGSSGIVTMEDILEEITGEIRDEFDEESEIRYRKLDDHNYLFEGQTLLNDVCRITGLAAGTFDEVRGAADTLAGLALELRGDIPKPGTELAWNNYLLTVIAADNRKIDQLKLTLAK